MLTIIRFKHDNTTIARHIAYSLDNERVIAPGLSQEELDALETFVLVCQKQDIGKHGASLSVMTPEEQTAYERLVDVVREAYEQSLIER